MNWFRNQHSKDYPFEITVSASMKPDLKGLQVVYHTELAEDITLYLFRTNTDRIEFIRRSQ